LYVYFKAFKRCCKGFSIRGGQFYSMSALRGHISTQLPPWAGVQSVNKTVGFWVSSLSVNKLMTIFLIKC